MNKFSLWLFIRNINFALVLKSLYIKNFAIIDELNLDFNQGLTVITGETGAGKSIIMGALSLISGERADTQALRNPNLKCILEAVFDIQSSPVVLAFLAEYDLGQSNELILRREIAAQGKSRIFINDTPSTLQALTKLTSLILDLHRQFDTMDLQRSDFQRFVLDEMAGNHDILNRYQQAYQRWQNATRKLEQIRQESQLMKNELDYNEFLFKEIESLRLTDQAIEEAEIELEKLLHSDSIKNSLLKTNHIIADGDNPMLSQLKLIENTISPHIQYLPELMTSQERIKNLIVELKDIHADLDHLERRMVFDESRIEVLTGLVNEGNRLLKKHRLNSTAELIQLGAQLSEKINLVVNSEKQEEEWIEKRSEAESELTAFSKSLTAARKKQIKPFEQSINQLLKLVGMPNATITVQIQPIAFTLFGSDTIDFLFDANKTGKGMPVGKVASGGELSRLMLCIKSLLANINQMPTLIFDEIDSGISGETAVQVGNIMKSLATNHQLISITHLPQIAAKANHHLFIYKSENKEGVISTKVKQLAEEERVETLAEMLSGKAQNEKTKVLVRELMK